MDLQALLDELGAHPSVIKVELLLNEDYGFYLFVRVTYIVNVAENDADQIALCIIVDDRGGPAETAYYKQKPTWLKTTTFKDEVAVAAKAYQTAHPEFEYYSIEGADETQLFAIVRAYVFDSGTNKSSEKRFIVFKVDMTLKMRELI